MTFVAPSGATPAAWTNQPVAVTELFAFTRNRTKMELTSANQSRFLVNVAVAGSAASTLRVQYSTDQTTWTDVPGASVATNTTGLKVSTFTAVPAGAKQDVFLRVVGQGGDGAADPSYGGVALQLK